ncbi:MAG: HAD-IA family hydrolase [Flavobacteriia bacterium]|nr:HAD-IA family hydrolase [Flavobacteriia bacterium]
MKIDKQTFDHAEAILFDLGGVILNIDYNKTAEEFKNLGLTQFDELYSQAKQEGLFDELEMGKINGQTFVQHIKKLSPSQVNEFQIIHAWNAMLLDLPKENLAFLSQINKKKRSFLFSNTNEIHLLEFNKKIKENHSVPNLNSFFEKTYYSHIFGHRKPNPDGFIAICKENKLEFDKLIFIDDSIQHIESAKKLGINAFLFEKTDKLTSIIELD